MTITFVFSVRLNVLQNLHNIAKLHATVFYNKNYFYIINNDFIIMISILCFLHRYT